MLYNELNLIGYDVYSDSRSMQMSCDLFVQPFANAYLSATEVLSRMAPDVLCADIQEFPKSTRYMLFSETITFAP